MLTPEHDSYYMSADGYLVLYSVVDRGSLDVAEKVLERICSLKRGREASVEKFAVLYGCFVTVVLSLARRVIRNYPLVVVHKDI